MAEYIGERKGSNGLFSDEGIVINMSSLEKEIDSHPGNVWCLIFSLTREDAERLGYNSAEQWMNLLRSHRNDIAKEMRIAPENLRWTAAFHQKETHPHVHMMVWSTNPNEAYLSKNGIHHIKHTIASDIFRQDLYSIYNEQTMVRNQLKHNFRKRMDELVQSIYDYPVYHPELEYNFTALSVALQKQKDKKVYGYLPKKTKEIVDNIVCLIASEPEIEDVYDLWYQYQCEIYRTYTDAMPEKIPLWENEVFKSIRNMVVDAASQQTPKGVLDTADHYGDYCAMQVIKILGYTAELISDEVPYQEPMQYDGVDSRLKREIEAKKRGELMMSM